VEEFIEKTVPVLANESPSNKTLDQQNQNDS